MRNVQCPHYRSVELKCRATSTKVDAELES